MSLITEIPRRSVYLTPTVTFTATFNNPVLGAYGFGGVAANTDVSLLDVSNRFLYYLDRFSFSCSVDEGDYLYSLNTVPTLHASLRSSRKRIFHRDYTLTNYQDQHESDTMITTRSGSGANTNVVRLTFAGILNSIPAFVGIPAIVAQFTFDIYEIRDAEFIQDWRQRTSGGVS